jgi:hypothetical protein
LTSFEKDRAGLRKLRNKGLAAFASRDWDILRALVQSAPSESGYFLLQAIGMRGRLDTKLTDVVQGADDSLGLTIAGAIIRERSRRYRGAARAADVSDRQWEKYLPTLTASDQLLCEALAVDPTFGLAAAYLMSCRIDSMPEDKDDGELRLLAATKVPASGYLNLMMARSKKWGGSHEAMWDVANRFRDSERPGTLALPARAHFENWLYHYAFESSAISQGHAQSYFLRKKRELLSLSGMVLEEQPGGDPAQTLLSNNWLAMVLSYAGERMAARPHLRRVGSMPDPSVWYYFPAPARIQLNVARVGELMLPA